MNKTILYVVAAVVGIGLAVALFPKSEAPDLSSDFSASGVTSKSAGALNAADGDGPEAVEVTRNPDLPKRAEKAPALEGEEAAAGPKPSGVREAREAREATSAGAHVKAATMKWQALGLYLGKAGSSDEAGRARTMANKLNKLRREDNIDLEALLTEEEELLEELTSGASDENIDGAAEEIRDTIAAARAGDDG